MKQTDVLLHELAGAMLDGIPIDWTSAESSAADESMRRVLRSLKIIAEIAGVYGAASPLLDRQATFTDTESLGSVQRSEPAAEVLLLRPDTWGPLRLLEKVGEGAFGEVYRAWDPRLDREVALKLLTEGSSSRDSRATAIIQEGRLLARVRHPNVVTIYGAERIENQVGLWMEFVNGLTLEQTLKQGKTFSAAEVVDIGSELCHAISAVHRAGLLHRDIKTQNVMVAEDGRVVLMDFGAGLDLNDNATSGLAGTPLYLAPELLSGGEATARSDIYSVGVLLYHLLTGSYPVRAHGVRDLRLAHERRDRTDVSTARPDLSPKLARIIERAIDPQPEQRFQNVDALTAALRALKPRPRLVSLAYALSVAAALVLIVVTAWEMAGRRVGSSRTPSVLAATFLGINSVSAADVSPAIGSLVVLPMENLSTDPAQEYFAAGMTEELIGSLTRISGLKVVAMTSAMSFKESPKSPTEIARELKVDAVLTGSVQRAEGRARLRLQLLHAGSNSYRWTKEYERDHSEVLKLQTEVARDVADEIRVEITPDERTRMASVAAVNQAAHEEYLLGRYLFWKFIEEDRVRAIDHFNRAIETDPGYAAPYAGLAQAWWMRGALGQLTLKEVAPRVRTAATKALQLDPQLAEAHVALSYVQGMFDWDWTGAERTIRYALDLNPNSLEAHYAYSLLLMALGRLPEAVAHIEHAAQLDPLSARVHSTFGRILYRARKFDEAIARLNLALELEPRELQAYVRLGDVYEQMGKHDEALGLYRKSGLAAPSARIALVYARMGRTNEARQMVKDLGARAGGPAAVYAELGERDAAFNLLFKTVEERAEWQIYIKEDPIFGSLHSDARWTQLLGRMNLPPD